ncbi:hypothetical protein L1887_27800 [Cichorium endivia]|nr:hypothetical protein L1887_27800 [Cichorium endivia]
MKAEVEEMRAQMEEMKTFMKQCISTNEGVRVTSPGLKTGSVGFVSDELDAIKASHRKPIVEQAKGVSTVGVPPNQVQQSKHQGTTKSSPPISVGGTKKVKVAKEFVTSETETSELETFDMPKELKKMPLVIQKMYTRLMSRKDLDDGVYVEVEPGILGPEKTETYI